MRTVDLGRRCGWVLGRIAVLTVVRIRRQLIVKYHDDAGIIACFEFRLPRRPPLVGTYRQ